jgi:hypothetical protein
MPKDFKRVGRTDKFLDNIERLIPNEIASCFGVSFDLNGRAVIDKKRGLGALVGGCVLIAAALDIASSAAKGLKWTEYSGKKHSNAMKEWTRDYLPSPYRAINWYRDFRSALVHNFCPAKLELTHHDRFRSRHLKEVRVKGKNRTCVHIFRLLEDLNKGLEHFAKQVRVNPDLYKCVNRYVTNHPVLEPRNPD